MILQMLKFRLTKMEIAKVEIKYSSIAFALRGLPTFQTLSWQYWKSLQRDLLVEN